MVTKSVEKDIQDELLKARVSRRRKGDVPYPMKYSTNMADFDIWDHMWIMSCCRSLTMHQFTKPPQVVLDLGCGSGYWTIEAAKQWPHSTIVGFDVHEIQPKLHLMDSYKHLAPRVKWVHGNFLERLPFRSSHFDFVRIVGIGLGVPEDEWQYVLEEISRVMKPGAVLEIIEEDLIFPCAAPRPRRTRPPLLDVDLPISESFPSNTSSATLLSDRDCNSAEGKSLLPSVIALASVSTLNSPTSFVSPTSMKSGFSNTISHMPRTLSVDYEPSHPQDHTRLKIAWEAMLASRFICAKLLSVLPFYISSSSFVEVQTHPACKISLPTNSGVFHPGKQCHFRHDSTDRQFGVRPSLAARSLNSDGFSVRSMGNKCQTNAERWATMHLAKTVNSIKSCKEAIWAQYAILFPHGREPSVRPVDFRRNKLVDARRYPREAFEIDWSEWENDMMDRIGMRDRLFSLVAWQEPSGDSPDWRVWRSKLSGKTSSSSADSGHGVAASNPDDLCRSLGGFVAYKPVLQASSVPAR